MKNNFTVLSAQEMRQIDGGQIMRDKEIDAAKGIGCYTGGPAFFKAPSWGGVFTSWFRRLH